MRTGDPMKAVVQNEYGGVDKLHYVTDAAEPELADDQVLVSVAAASVNPVDWKMRSGAAKERFPLTFPAILGRDVSGIVRAIGSRVGGVAVGDRVMALANNTYAELVAVPAADITHIPDGLDTVDAASLPLVAVTGDQLIRMGCQLQAGQTVLVTGATGSVGRCAVHSAKTLGAKVIAGVRKSGLEAAKALGCNAVVALDDKDQMETLGFVDAVADTVGGETASKLLSKVLPGGVFASVVGVPAGSELNPTVRTMRVGALPDPPRVRTFAEDLVAGTLVLPIAEKFALAEVGHAQTVAEGGAGGKVLLLVL